MTVSTETKKPETEFSRRFFNILKYFFMLNNGIDHDLIANPRIESIIEQADAEMYKIKNKRKLLKKKQ